MVTESRTESTLSPAEVIDRYGRCLELVPIDPHFHDVSVGLYMKGDLFTVWTYSRTPGVERRVEQIRGQLVALGGLLPVDGTHDQVKSPCDNLHARPMRFLMARAVGKDPDYTHPGGGMTIKDTKTKLVLNFEGRQEGSRWVYRVSGEGEAPNPAMRLRMVVAGFVRYGEMEKVSDTEVTFECGQRHDALLRLLMPYSRNVTAVESSMEAEDLRGQMTTGTLGFSQQ